MKTHKQNIKQIIQIIFKMMQYTDNKVIMHESVSKYIKLSCSIINVGGI